MHTFVASSGFEKAIAESGALRKGVNMYLPPRQHRSVISCRPVAQALGLEYMGLPN